MDTCTKSGVIGGTLFSAIFNITWDNIVFTVVMAAIGAIVSYFVSLLLQKFTKKKPHK
ncbi:hypothetical protein [Mesonia sp. K7]|uniref:hypothetical protein n=1 Tax=Mesonia sp. K7 TaxID=2218606 RepID=UPI0018F23F47|nr:hypothetical protein [Mesonia sp. K7]